MNRRTFIAACLAAPLGVLFPQWAKALRREAILQKARDCSRRGRDERTSQLYSLLAPLQPEMASQGILLVGPSHGRYKFVATSEP